MNFIHPSSPSPTQGTDLTDHYRQEDGVFLVEIKLSAARRLFNSLDPAPFFDKDLDDAAEQYIVGAVREFPLQTPLKLVFHLPPEEVAGETQSMIPAVHNYFDYRHLALGRELRLKLQQGRISLAIGLAFLFLCIAARQVVGVLGEGMLVEIVEEGLLIIGWVAMWRPLEIFLYDWWPIAQARNLYAKLRTMPMEVRSP